MGTLSLTLKHTREKPYHLKITMYRPYMAAYFCVKITPFIKAIARIETVPRDFKFSFKGNENQ